jgi:hypothetical protein
MRNWGTILPFIRWCVLAGDGFQGENGGVEGSTPTLTVKIDELQLVKHAILQDFG